MKPVNSPIGTLSTASKGGNPPDITTVSERTMKSMPSVVMKLGISNLSVMKALRKPMTAHIEYAHEKRRPERNAGIEHERDAHRHDRENRADGEIEFAANHQHREADRHRSDLGQQSEHAADVLKREEDAIRPDLEERRQRDEENNPGQLGLLQINLDALFIGIFGRAAVRSARAASWAGRERRPRQAFSGGPSRPSRRSSRPGSAARCRCRCRYPTAPIRRSSPNRLPSPA